MQCADFEKQLNQRLDDRLPPESDSTLAAHARQCSDCRELLAASRAMLEAVALQPAPAVPANLAERVVAGTHPRPSRAWLLFKVGLPIAIAAAVLLAFLPHLFPPGAGPAVQPPAVPEVAKADPELGADEVAMVAPHALVEADAQYMAMLRLTGQAMATLPSTVRRASGTREMALVTEGMRPVTHSMSAVFHVLRGTLPSKTDSES